MYECPHCGEELFHIEDETYGCKNIDCPLHKYNIEIREDWTDVYVRVNEEYEVQNKWCTIYSIKSV